MLPSLLITFREIIEASLIVATIIGILYKLRARKNIKTVWMAAASAIGLSLTLLIIGSVLGLKVQELFKGKTAAAFEGAIMILSSVFVTWAVFFLHKQFAKDKVHLLQKVQSTLNAHQERGIFALVFTAVIREGLEIVLFLSTIYFSTNPGQILLGFILGSLLAVGISLSLFTATLKLPVFKAFRLTSILLVLFAAGMLASGLQELMEAGLIPAFSTFPQITLSFLPASTTFLGETIKGVFGITRTMHLFQILLYGAYVSFMSWILFFRKQISSLHQ